MAHGGLPAPTVAQKALWRKLLDQVGCAACLFFCRHEDGSRVENSIGEIHHILSGGNRISHTHVIPLCRMHHTDGKPGYPSRHSIAGQYGKAQFEAVYAPELELAEMCGEWIDDFYLPGQSDSDDDTETDNDRCADSDADHQPDDGYARAQVERLQAFDSPVHISVTHYRARLCDPDNLNAKGVIDAIVKAGLLQDDSAAFVKSIRHSQVKVPGYDQEKTRIQITEAIT